MIETKFLDDYKGFGKSLYLTNGVVDLIVSLNIGPRVLRYGYVGEDNIFLADTENKCIVHQTSPALKDYYGEEHYYCTYGGHRLWQAPEVHPKTHYPDNFPIEYEILDNGVKLIAPVQHKNLIQSSITLTFGEGTEIAVHQEIQNMAPYMQEFAAWSITMCATGGVEILRRNTSAIPGNPNMSIALWSHADFTNNTIFIGKKYITIVQPTTHTSMKIGFELEHGDTYYVNGDTVFKKEFSPIYPYGNYTDRNSSFETYSCMHFTELEACSEFKKLAPKQSVTLDEKWSLCRKPCDFDPRSDASIDEFFSKL